LAAAAGEDGDVAAICAELDGGRGPAPAGPPEPAGPVGVQAADRLRAREPKTAAGFSVGGGDSMEAREGMLMSWSPLVGLTCDAGFDLGAGTGVGLVAASPATVLTMEDKDVRRELGNLLMIETPTACLGVARTAGADVAAMLRARDLAVVALRLAGFGAFTDPELLGSYVYEGSIRTIDTTVFAAMILRGMGADPAESFGAGDAERLAPDWALVVDYETRARNGEVDHVLALYRRAQDSDFLPATARATLLVAIVEAMLGRFRPPGEQVQLEDLVRAVAGEDAATAAEWFAEHGRDFRNAVAHGHWDRGPEPLVRMQELLRPLIRSYLRTWLDVGDPARRPGRAFTKSVTAAAAP
jgi:hypothetical protein